MSTFFWMTVGRMFARDRGPVRKRPSWKTKLLRTLAVVLFVAVCVGVYEFPRVQFLQVRNVDVIGVSQLDAHQIVAASGISGKNILLIDPNEVSSRLEKNPYLASATVQRDWFSRSVQIDVQERSPRLVWETSNGTFLVSDTGVVLSKVANTPRMPTIQVEGGPKLSPGDQLNQSQIGYVLNLYSVLPPDLRPMIEKVTYNPEMGYEILSSSGWKAVLGDSSDLRLKIDIMSQLVQKKPKAALVDVTNPVTPFYRLKKSG